MQSPPHPPDPWLASTPLMDLDDTRLRLKAQSLVQLAHGEREAALAVYGFVKRLPFQKTLKLRLNTARAVLDRGLGDADDKITLLVAMLRACGLPARVEYLAIEGRILQGLTGSVGAIARPVLQVWLADHWARTDTYIFDAPFVAAARERLRDAGTDWGYGVGRHGATLWSGSGDAFLFGTPEQAAGIVRGSLGIFHDPAEFLASPQGTGAFGGLARILQWNLIAPAMERTVSALRAQGRS